MRIASTLLQVLMTLQISKVRAAALKHGWRSGLEEKVAEHLDRHGIQYEYERHKISYIVPSRVAKYTPDFYIKSRSGKTIICESKGRFETADRQKHLLVKAQHPELDIRFVFSSSRQRISKASRTTYAMWCEKHGFQYADKLVPKEWLNE